MKLPLITVENKKVGEKELPPQFNEEYRPDMIKRAVLALSSAARHPYGPAPDAGQRYSSEVSKRRRDYRGSYGAGISRVRRKILSRRGMRMFWVGATTPQTVGGRRAHPPKAEKTWQEKINKKETRKAIRSAMGATLATELVKKRGHRLPTQYPFILDNKIETIAKTKDILLILNLWGFSNDIERAAVQKTRSGAAARRGRKYRGRKGLLIVVSQECPLIKAAQNIPGVDVVTAKSLNAYHLAPGAHPGRATLWTSAAVDTIAKNKLFL